GRRLLPTVLKIAQKEITDRETEAYLRFVKPFILNNSTALMGSAAAGEWAGLSYSFVGINGPESRLSWFRDIYLENPVEASLPIFERVFREVLKPWYGQPKWEKVHLYRDHDPQRMFPDILATAHREMGIDADHATIHCHYLQEDLPNPLYFLKHVYPDRLREAKLWYTAVTHGDLNLQNILLDERENIYIIDFSETGHRNITADFARLEPIFKIELTRISSEQDVHDLLIFEKKLLETKSLQERPENAYPGDDPQVEKAYKFICKLREYANQVTIFEDDIKPYLLAMLEWTLPVICYVNVDAPGKKFALFSSALICRRLLKKD
ncbi:MAG: phosphotransferase, partial [Candidatus Cloacimonetes bacterium]|nr:phosphotransferase [Candidatus Cloacimonadota bacterium]